YNSGKEHQNQGALLSQGGSKTEALDEYQKSIAEYREAIGLQPDYPQAHENLAVALYDIGDLQSALEEYRIAIDQYTKRDGRPTSQVVTNYGLALYDLGRYDDSAKAFGQALQIEPSDHDLYVHRGFALQNAGRTQEARSDYERYLSLEPTGQYAEGVRQVLSGKANPPVRSGNQ
ncbi:MAG: tetratricopeptide repeat protein, partial [Blastocatellia bacterium]